MIQTLIIYYFVCSSLQWQWFSLKPNHIAPYLSRELTQIIFTQGLRYFPTGETAHLYSGYDISNLHPNGEWNIYAAKMMALFIVKLLKHKSALEGRRIPAQASQNTISQWGVREREEEMRGVSRQGDNLWAASGYGACRQGRHPGISHKHKHVQLIPLQYMWNASEANAIIKKKKWKVLLLHYSKWDYYTHLSRGTSCTEAREQQKMNVKHVQLIVQHVSWYVHE